MARTVLKNSGILLPEIEIPYSIQMSSVEKQLSEEAIEFVKKSRKKIIAKFAAMDHGAMDSRVTVFMAGSPGAGKTELAKGFVEKSPGPIVRIDADEIRKMLPGYIGANAHIFQAAANKGVEILYDYVIKNGLPVIMDSTFSSQKVAQKNVERAIKKERNIIIVYIYQDPVVAWLFTRAREITEGRRVGKEDFIKSFLESPRVVQKIKDQFGDRVNIWFVRRSLQHKIEEFVEDVQKVDKYIGTEHTESSLKKLLESQ